MNVRKAIVAAAVGLALCVSSAGVALAGSDSSGFQPVTLCHASPTGEGNSGPAKQYELITVDNQGALDGHSGHPNDIIPAPLDESGAPYCPTVDVPTPSPTPPPPPVTGPPVPPVTPPVVEVRYRIFTTMPRFHYGLVGPADLSVTVTRACGFFRVTVGDFHLRVFSTDRTFLRVKSEGKLLASAIGQKHGC